MLKWLFALKWLWGKHKPQCSYSKICLLLPIFIWKLNFYWVNGVFANWEAPVSLFNGYSVISGTVTLIELFSMNGHCMPAWYAYEYRCLSGQPCLVEISRFMIKPAFQNFKRLCTLFNTGAIVSSQKFDGASWAIIPYMYNQQQCAHAGHCIRIYYSHAYMS